MLQKHRYGRKDRAEIRISGLLLVSRMLSVPVGQLIPGVARGRKVLEWARKMRHHSGGAHLPGA